ncbi:PrsW family intramembrane metalloprotease [Nonomuraea angiospora]|uniref:RsiW-degrading membrane proteinase PrsW (M82 family) n=2 Tax=Nonomuraea TaxID=83681 RepID=A0A7W9GHK3_9ACTN|nr:MULTISPECIES: PrsW family intramembrane metalloprotease [Nonomuraea]MBB5783965.1 RsiW-degrading membrane proteinase PrsW (M82 family) [Nonomuraea jabiensis]MBE1584871.1 RsiW-degrading membrane proteinase PrsW (M82 family) [Nonomuraea angiospora]MDX3107567.1 PrsW family intramembrane metalloprotease [Nonomuraea angiospora]
MATRDPRWVLKDRPSFALIIGLVLTGVCALVSFSFDVLNGAPVQFFIALMLALAPVPLLLAAVLALDRMEPEPRSNLIFAFAWGAGVAVLVAGLINYLNLHYIIDTAKLSEASARNVAATFGAPVVEETMKGLVLLGLLRFRRAELDGPTDGIIYASMVGLGFAMSENVSYYLAALSNSGVKGLAVTVVLRGILSPLAHPLFSSMIGVAVAYAARREGPERVFYILAGWSGAMILHGLWNGLASYGGFPGLVVAYLALLAVLIVLIGVVFKDRRRIVALIQRYLPPYEPTKLVTQADIYMLSTFPRRRQARQWAKAHGGKRGLRAMRDYQLAATELGLLHERAARHMVDEQGFHEEQRALLECMSTARADFPVPTAHARSVARGTPPPGYAPGAPG